MTDFDHAEISRRLALAIGWPLHELDEYDLPNPGVLVLDDGDWRELDYRDPAVIWPIAERFNCFPAMVSSGTEWVAYTAGAKTTWADTAALAVAMAVINAKEKT